MRKTYLALLPALALGAAPAFAQEEPAEPVAAESGDKNQEIWKDYPSWMGKSEFPRISDDEETIYSVQRKAFLVNEKIEITPMVAATFTDRFVQTVAPAASVTYHLAENFGIELGGGFMFPFESGLTEEILKKGKLTPEIAKLTQLLWAAGIGAQWSPIYGKLEVLGTSLGNFAFYVGVSAGLGQTRVQCTSGLDLDPEAFGQGAKCPQIQSNNDEDAFKVVYEPNRTHMMASISGGVRFYFSSTLGLKLEVKDWVFPARVYRPGTAEPTQRYTDAIRNNVFVQLGVSMLFGGEDN